MPVITLDIGKLTKEQKAQLVRHFTEAAHQVTCVPKSAFVVIINEHELDNIGAGGELFSERMK